MKILIAEDEVSIAKALKVMLEKNRYTVDMVYNGTDALDYGLQGAYDAMVLDVMMPGMNGLEVLRTLKIHTAFSLDGVRMTLSGITNDNIILSPLTPLLVGKETEAYIKAMESFQNKRDRNPSIEPDEAHDGLSGAGNRELYDLLAAKLEAWPYRQMPGKVVLKGEEAETRFDKASLTDQIKLLLGVLQWMSGKKSTCDLSLIGGGPSAGARTPSCNLSNWKKRYRDVRIIDSSAAGLFEQRSGNLLEEL